MDKKGYMCVIPRFYDKHQSADKVLQMCIRDRIKDGEIIYSGVTIDPSEILDVQQPPNQVETKIDGRNILISGSQVMLNDGAYSVYVVRCV